MPTIEELLALPFIPPASGSDGISAEDYRAQYRLHGRPVRWWKAMPMPPGATGPNGEAREENGCCYIEQLTALDGVTPLSQVRAVFWSTMQSVPHREFGYVAQALTEIGVLPDEIRLLKLDRVAPADVEWLGRTVVTRGVNSLDTLPNNPVQSILSVVVDGVAADVNDYEAVDAGIRWKQNAPNYGTKYAVKYSYHPVFEFLGSEQLVASVDAKGRYLPQRGQVRWVQAKY